MKLLIVIPMHNEEKIARQSLETILSYTRQLPQPVKVLVVNDCSCDDTEKIVKAIIAEQPDDHVHLVSHGRNQGYGGANRTGIQFAIDRQYDYVLFMDSDLTNHPKYLIDFYQKMQAGFDYIKASRYISGGAMQGVPYLRRLISATGNRVAQFLFGVPIHDCTNGFRAAKVELIRRMQLHENKFEVIMEELYYAKLLAKTFAEVPYILTSRSQDEKPSSFSYRPTTFLKYLKYALKSFFRIKPQFLFQKEN